MFTLDQNEFDDIMNILAAHCVHECPRKKGMPCRMSNCDIDKIYNILHSHLVNDDDLPF